jgi:hypothetical protein
MQKRWVFTQIGDQGEVRDGPEMYMWLTYRVFAQDGTWPLPQMAQVRNVYWDANTQRQVAGQPFRGEDWLPASVPASNPVPASAHRFTFANGETVIGVAT